MSLVVAAPDESAASCTMARRAYSTVCENMFYLILRVARGAPGVVMKRPSLAFRNFVFKQICVLKIGGVSNFADNNESQVRLSPKRKV